MKTIMKFLQTCQECMWEEGVREHGEIYRSLPFPKIPTTIAPDLGRDWEKKRRKRKRRIKWERHMGGALCPAKIYSYWNERARETSHPLFPTLLPPPPLISIEFSKISYSERNKLWRYWTSLSFPWNISQLNPSKRAWKWGCAQGVATIT